MTISKLSPAPRRTEQGFPLTTLQHDDIHDRNTVPINALIDYINQLIGDTNPPGIIFEYAGDALPTGYLWANFGEFNKVTYPRLTVALNGKWENGFEAPGYGRLPPRQGMVGIGANPMGLITYPTWSNYTVGTYVGSQTVMSTSAGTVTVDQITATGTGEIAPFTPSGAVAITDIVMSPHNLSGLGVTVTGSTVANTTGGTAPTISGSGTLNPTFTATPFNISYTPTGVNGAIGNGTFTTNVSAVTVSNTTGTQALTITGSGTLNPTFAGTLFNVSYTPTGTNGAIGNGTFTTNISAVTVSNLTGFQALTITGAGTLNPTFAGTLFNVSYTPTGTNGAIGNGTFTTNVSAVTVASTTGTTALSIGGTGTVTSNTVTGVQAIPSSCVLVGVGDASTNVARCLPITVSDFTVGISASAIATALSLSPNGHSHSIPALSVTVTQGVTGALTPSTWTASNSLNQNVTPAGTVSILASTVASALSISPDPHQHTIPALAITVTQGVTGSLIPSTWTATNSLNQNVTPAGTVSILASTIASALSISPNPHSHTIPALAVTVTQGVTGALIPPIWTATNSLNQNITVTGTVSILASTIAAALSVGSHTHTIPSLVVNGTGTITGTIPDHTFVSGTATFTGDEIQPAVTIEINPFTPLATYEGDAESLSIIQPGIVMNYIIKY